MGSVSHVMKSLCEMCEDRSKSYQFSKKDQNKQLLEYDFTKVCYCPLGRDYKYKIILLFATVIELFLLQFNYGYYINVLRTVIDKNPRHYKHLNDKPIDLS